MCWNRGRAVKEVIRISFLSFPKDRMTNDKLQMSAKAEETRSVSEKTGEGGEQNKCMINRLVT